MINLSCTVFQAKGDVIQQVVVRRPEVCLHNAGEQRFASVLRRVGAVRSIAANGKADGKSSEEIENGPVLVRRSEQQLP